ncbi:MAG: hypothetical protein RLZZ44_1311 [Bacteroidota bacterium]|jgi:hypothetical protein
MAAETKITCPNCGTEIDVNDVISHQLEAQFKHQYESKLQEERKKFDAESEKIAEERLALDKLKKEQEKLVEEKVNNQLRQEKTALEATLKAKLAEELAAQMNTIQEELKEKTEKVKLLNQAKADLEKLKREKEELKDALELENQEKLTQLISEEKEKIRKSEKERSELAIKELQKQLEDQRKLTEEMQRKQEQGSMQLQGEVQELGIEEYLSNTFPFDEIIEIKKGERGADCLQIVNTRTQSNCGTIYYESKRTKEFSKTWIEKFKGDIREKGAHVGVLVTEVYPKSMDRMGLYEGIWICSYDEFKGLSMVLRESIIQLSNAVATQENKGDKMVMLYDYLTSNDFKLQIEAIVEGFTELQIGLLSEKKAMNAIWKKRELQIEKVILNTTFMYQSVRGIAGSAVQPIKSLELPSEDAEEV